MKRSMFGSGQLKPSVVPAPKKPGKVIPMSFDPTLMLELEIGIRLPSLLNMRCHWGAKAEIAASQRDDVKEHFGYLGQNFLNAWRCVRANEELKIHVTLTRVSPRELDGDNLQGAFKHVRDEIAKQLGVNDKSKRYVWLYRQRPGAQQLVKLRIKIAPKKSHLRPPGMSS